jgi:hypothetical protein
MSSSKQFTLFENKIFAVCQEVAKENNPTWRTTSSYFTRYWHRHETAFFMMI